MPKTATPRKPETLERRMAETRNTSRNRNLAGLLGLQDRNPLRDMLSAANDVTGRGMIAGFLGLPGDLGGMAENGIRYALGMPQVTPYGGSEHIGQQMEKAGLVTAKRRPVAETLASLISPSAAATAVFKAPAAARAGVRMLDNLAAPRTMGSQTGAIENLWHGSPHTFDRFDLSKIGTGEGNQAYGHGAYLAEQPETAKSYAEALGREVTIQGKPAFRAVDGTTAGDLPISYGATNVLKMSDWDLGKAKSDMLDTYRETGDGWFKSKYDELSSISPEDIVIKDGNLYQTRLAWPDPAREATDPLSPDHFLHWDKPLSEQPDIARVIYGDRVDAFGNPMPLSSYDKHTGAMAYEDFSSRMGKSAIEQRDGLLAKYGADPKGPLTEWKSALSKMTTEDRSRFTEIANEIGNNSNPSAASQALRQAGIPGIRYLDGGSRGAGAGSHNYVVFDDRLIDIVSRNGQPVGNLGKMVAPQDEALRVAQQNAAKPIEEGGLGLRPDNTPEERAAAMGFDTPAYHGTNSDFSAFSLDHAGRASGTEQFGSGVYVAQDPQLASGYADARIDGGNVMPLLVRQKSPITPETKKALTRGQIESILKKAPELDEALWNFGDVGYEGKAKVLRNAVNQFYDAQGETMLDTLHPLANDMYRGYPQEFNDTISAILKRDGVLAGEEGNRIMSLWNPNQVRSRFAAFDPMRRDSSDILAGLSPLGLGAWMYQGGSGE